MHLTWHKYLACDVYGDVTCGVVMYCVVYGGVTSDVYSNGVVYRVCVSGVHGDLVCIYCDCSLPAFVTMR